MGFRLTALQIEPSSSILHDRSITSTASGLSDTIDPENSSSTELLC